MADPTLCDDFAGNKMPLLDTASPELWATPKALIDALIDIDMTYERERERINLSPLDVISKSRLQRKLKAQHLERRQRYVQRLISMEEWIGPRTKSHSPDQHTGTLAT